MRPSSEIPHRQAEWRHPAPLLVLWLRLRPWWWLTLLLVTATAAAAAVARSIRPAAVVARGASVSCRALALFASLLRLRGGLLTVAGIVTIAIIIIIAIITIIIPVVVIVAVAGGGGGGAGGGAPGPTSSSELAARAFGPPVERRFPSIVVP
jgi:hypothetical protein